MLIYACQESRLSLNKWDMSRPRLRLYRDRLINILKMSIFSFHVDLRLSRLGLNRWDMSRPRLRLYRDLLVNILKISKNILFVYIHLSWLILNSQDLVSTFETKAKRPTCEPSFSTCQDSHEKCISISYWHLQNINILVSVKFQTTYLSNWVKSVDKR
jgi:hypothetical protein